MITAGIIGAVGIIFLLLKFNLKRLLRFDITIDIVATFFFIWIFLGTFTGMVAGLLAGAIVSVFLYVARKFIPREELKIVKIESFPFRKLVWTES